MDATQADEHLGTSPLPMTGIVLGVGEAETLVRSRMMQVHPSLLPRDRSLVAHITLLAPFHPEPEIDDRVLGQLADFFADMTQFDFALTEVCQFPSGITYLAPEPASTFRRITSELHRLFPEFPPYGGAFDEVVPHLTVPLPEGESTRDLRARLEPSLPLHAYALEATLVHVALDDTRVLATFPFGTSAA